MGHTLPTVLTKQTVNQATVKASVGPSPVARVGARTGPEGVCRSNIEAVEGVSRPHPPEPKTPAAHLKVLMSHMAVTTTPTTTLPKTGNSMPTHPAPCRDLTQASALAAPEGVDVARLVLAGQALLVAGAVLADVLGVGLGQLLNGSHDGL